MSKVSHSPAVTARRVASAARFLSQAGKQLTAATRPAGRYHQQRLRGLLVDLRELSSPVADLVSSLECRGGQ